MRMAIPIWEDKISPVLDTALRLLIVEVDGRSESSRSVISLDEQDLMRRCLRIKGLGVDIIICSAISQPFLKMLKAGGIEIIPEISGTPEDVLQAYMNGNLLSPKYMAPWFNRNSKLEY